MGAGISLFNIIIIALQCTCDRLKVMQEKNTDRRWTCGNSHGNIKVRCGKRKYSN